MNRHRRLMLLAISMALTLAVGACVPVPSAPAAVNTAPVAATTAPADSAKTPVSGGTLKISTVPDATVLGYPPTMTKLYDLSLALTSLEALISFDTTGAPVAGLAKEWKVDAAAKTITLVLQKGVKFHDGSDFNAKVVKWNLDTIRTSQRTELKAVESIDVVDDNTVQLKLSKFDNSILTSLGGTAGLMISQAAFEKNGGAAWAERNPVGTGPFKLVSWQKDVKQVYARFDGYWQKGKPYLDGVEWTIIADPLVRLASFRAGETDVIRMIEPKDAKAMEKEGKYQIATIASALYGISGDSGRPESVFANLKVRQAVEYAIDKQAICDSLGYGYWKPLYQAAAPGSWAENPKVVGYKYDPAKAKQLLTEAGFPNGFKTTIFTPNSPQIMVDMLTAVQGYLKAVGIDAKIDAMDHARFGDIYAGAGWKDGFAMMPMGLSPDEIGLMNRLYLPGSILVPNAVRPAAFQQKLAEVGAAADFETKQKLTWELQKLGTDENAMVVWLYADVGLSASQGKVHDDGFSKSVPLPWTPAQVWIEK